MSHTHKHKLKELRERSSSLGDEDELVTKAANTESFELAATLVTRGCECKCVGTMWRQACDFSRSLFGSSNVSSLPPVRRRERREEEEEGEGPGRAEEGVGVGKKDELSPGTGGRFQHTHDPQTAP